MVVGELHQLGVRDSRKPVKFLDPGWAEILLGSFWVFAGLAGPIWAKPRHTRRRGR